MKKIIISLLCLAVISLLSACGPKTDAYLLSDGPESVLTGETRTSAQPPGPVYVYICGAVKKPGVYELKTGSRICDALKKAGGFAKGAARESLNLAETVSDGQMIRIVTRKELKDAAKHAASDTAEVPAGADPGAFGGSDPSAQSPDSTGKVNLNTADLNALMTLNGIGQAKAAQIIAFREANGSFQTTEDLMKVPGIKQGTYDKLKDQVTVG